MIGLDGITSCPTQVMIGGTTARFCGMLTFLSGRWNLGVDPASPRSTLAVASMRVTTVQNGDDSQPVFHLTLLPFRNVLSTSTDIPNDLTLGPHSVQLLFQVLSWAIGNVGEGLVGYTDSDTFLSRDAGFTWEEVHKDARLYEFGDSGSIIIMANDEEPTDHVLSSTDEGLNRRECRFSTQPVRVRSVLADTRRRFILFGCYGRSSNWVAIHQS